MNTTKSKLIRVSQGFEQKIKTWEAQLNNLVKTKELPKHGYKNRITTAEITEAIAKDPNITIGTILQYGDFTEKLDNTIKRKRTRLQYPTTFER